MRPGDARGRALAALLALACAAPVAACNPDPPRPPILEGQPYDEVARDFLLANAPTVAVLRLEGRMDLVFEHDGPARADFGSYQFELVEGWGETLPARISVSGWWIPCEPGLVKGGHYLAYMEGRRPLYLVPAGEAGTEIERLGGVDWFYDVRGQLVRPELVDDVGAAAEDGNGKE